MSRIAVIGTGYVGLTTGACFAHLGHDVVCSDVVEDKVASLSRGEVPILEPRLDELVRDGLASGHLRFVLGNTKAVEDCEFAFLCVPTPQAADGSADLSYIEGAAAEIAPLLPTEAVVVNKSTVPVGSTRVVERVLQRPDVYVVSNPEFLREGSAVHDFLNPDRIVIGSEDQAAAIRVSGLYATIQAPTLVTDPATAETIKYASNAFLATKVSYVNALAAVCEAVGADVKDVVLGMGYDHRIGFEFLRPGPGFGGSCLVGDESVVVRRHGEVRLLSMAALFQHVERIGSRGWEALSWRPGDSAPEFKPVSAFTARPYTGDVIEVRTKMGRRVVTTTDHPFLVGDGRAGDIVDVKTAEMLTAADWLPVAQGTPPDTDTGPELLHVLDALGPADVAPEDLIVRFGPRHRAAVAHHRDVLAPSRRLDVLRSGTMRLSELRAHGCDEYDISVSTVRDGTYVPSHIPLDEAFWRVIGLYLAEGHVSDDGPRRRICWAFNHSGEDDLVDFLTTFWSRHGVKTAVHQSATSRVVMISSRVLASTLVDVLGAGRNAYEKNIPDLVWLMPEEAKEALLRGLWDGDGSWSLVNRGPSVVLEYGTVSRRLADGMVRLLGELGIVARLKVGRTHKSTVDTYWLTVSGAEQVDRASFLLPVSEQWEVNDSIRTQAKRIAPTGYRRLSKHAAWVRVTDVERRPFAGTVYSIEVPETGTFVTTFGLCVHNCFPKDTKALIHTAQSRGYEFQLLEGVVEVNEQQFERITDKVARAAGGSVDGARIAVWGLTFKANTDDLRDSPSLEIVRRLQERGAVVQAYDPAVPPGRHVRELEGLDVDLRADAFAACEDARVLVVLTEWDEFRFTDLDKVRSVMAEPVVVDARNLLDHTALTRRGFTYEGVGRP